MKNRRAKIVEQFGKLKVDAFLVSHLPNVRYLTGFTGSSALLLLTAKDSLLLTDPRYDIQSRQETDCEVRVVKGKSLWTAIGPILKRRKQRKVGFESAHATHAHYAAVEEFARMTPLSGVVETERMVKSSDEIALIRRSVEINSQAFAAALERFRPGMSERELAAEIEYRQRLLGAEGPSFDTIVASGVRSALPHAHPTEAAIHKDEVLLIDMGALYGGYASDMTRVVFPGSPGNKVKQIYSAVLEAQLAAIDAVRPGVVTRKVDKAARQSLEKHKLDKLFTHSTGHGLGLEIHELPGLRRKDKTVLKPGMVITIEPGVYVEGLGGVRIEDTVLVTATGCEVLTPTSKQMLNL